MKVRADVAAVASAVRAVNDARSHITRASGAARAATTCPVAEVPAALDAVQTDLLAAWEALTYVDAILEASVGGDTDG